MFTWRFACTFSFMRLSSFPYAFISAFMETSAKAKINVSEVPVKSCACTCTCHMSFQNVHVVYTLQWFIIIITLL